MAEAVATVVVFVLVFDDDRDPLSALFDGLACRLAKLVMGR